MSAARSAAWIGEPERGSLRMLRLMAFVSLRLGRRLSRLPLYGIVLYFFLFAPTARRHARRYLQLALDRAPTARDWFRHLLYFSTTIHDRIFLINARERLFEISVEGAALMQEQLATGRGAFLMGSHMGSFEVVSSVGRQQRGLRVAMAMFEANARKVGAILGTTNPALRTDVIGLGQIDAMLSISERLAGGSFVGVLADRTLGEEALQEVTVLGRRARLPTGPMRTAAILRCPVIFMIGLYRGKNRYHVVFAPLADFSQVSTGARAAAVREAVDRYAALLDRYCRSDPYNWFNFFDFWADRPLGPRR
jgi:predicted LPLAT superfamily acyltransferase